MRKALLTGQLIPQFSTITVGEEFHEDTVGSEEKVTCFNRRDISDKNSINPVRGREEEDHLLVDHARIESVARED